MSSKLASFFQKAVKAQMEMAGDSLTILRKPTNQTYTVTGILTSRDGTTTAESGGTVYSITAHALIPVSTAYTPKVGDRITSGGHNFLIISTICSPNDAAWSCDLITVQK